MYKNSKRNVIYPVFLAVAVALGILLGMLNMNRGQSAAKGLPKINERTFNDNKLVHALSLIDKYYVDSVDVNSLTESALDDLIRQLDPHSSYIPAQNYAQVNEVLEGEFDGIGVLFNMTTDTVIVLNVVPGGPSERAGVLNGDRVIMIDDSLVAGKKIHADDIKKMLRGRRGSEVDLSVQRNGVKDLVPITVVRDKVEVKSLDAAFMIQPGIAYIKLSAFAKNSEKEILAALSRMREHGMEKLIFDLRDNSGGFLDQAIDIANQFLPAQELIVYTEDRNGYREEQYSNGQGQYKDLSLAILVDEMSASSSEILAGAIQDNDRGVIIGRRTFGKGLVQRQIQFSDGSAIRLTIARYYTPTGRSIQKPYDDGLEEYNKDILYRLQHNEMMVADSTHFDDSLRYTTPKGRIVYGGGGIMPDIFIPLDNIPYNQFYVQVVGKNILYRYALKYSDEHREQLNGLTSVRELNDMLDSDRNLFSNFLAYASREGVPARSSEVEPVREILTAQLRALIGRNSPLDDNGYYSNTYKIDQAILKAIEVLGDEDEMNSVLAGI